MANLDHRVLCRLGAREVTLEEANVVGGAYSGTDACSLVRFNALTQTHTGGDCDTKPGDTDTDS